jgi:hypothetical protein
MALPKITITPRPKPSSDLIDEYGQPSIDLAGDGDGSVTPETPSSETTAYTSPAFDPAAYNPADWKQDTAYVGMDFDTALKTAHARQLGPTDELRPTLPYGLPGDSYYDPATGLWLVNKVWSDYVGGQWVAATNFAGQNVAGDGGGGSSSSASDVIDPATGLIIPGKVGPEDQAAWEELLAGQLQQMNQLLGTIRDESGRMYRKGTELVDAGTDDEYTMIIIEFSDDDGASWVKDPQYDFRAASKAFSDLQKVDFPTLTEFLTDSGLSFTDMTKPGGILDQIATASAKYGTDLPSLTEWLTTNNLTMTDVSSLIEGLHGEDQITFAEFLTETGYTVTDIAILENALAIATADLTAGYQSIDAWMTAKGMSLKDLSIDETALSVIAGKISSEGQTFDEWLTTNNYVIEDLTGIQAQIETIATNIVGEASTFTEWLTENNYTLNDLSGLQASLEAVATTIGTGSQTFGEFLTETSGVFQDLTVLQDELVDIATELEEIPGLKEFLTNTGLGTLQDPESIQDALTELTSELASGPTDSDTNAALEYAARGMGFDDAQAMLDRMGQLQDELAAGKAAQQGLTQSEQDTRQQYIQNATQLMQDESRRTMDALLGESGGSLIRAMEHTDQQRRAITDTTLSFQMETLHQDWLRKESNYQVQADQLQFMVQSGQVSQAQFLDVVTRQKSEAVKGFATQLEAVFAGNDNLRRAWETDVLLRTDALNGVVEAVKAKILAGEVTNAQLESMWATQEQLRLAGLHEKTYALTEAVRAGSITNQDLLNRFETSEILRVRGLEASSAALRNAAETGAITNQELLNRFTTGEQLRIATLEAEASALESVISSGYASNEQIIAMWQADEVLRMAGVSDQVGAISDAISRGDVHNASLNSMWATMETLRFTRLGTEISAATAVNADYRDQWLANDKVLRAAIAGEITTLQAISTATDASNRSTMAAYMGDLGRVTSEANNFYNIMNAALGLDEAAFNTVDDAYEQHLKPLYTELSAVAGQLGVAATGIEYSTLQARIDAMESDADPAMSGVLSFLTSLAGIIAVFV